MTGCNWHTPPVEMLRPLSMASHSTARILVVDDEAEVRALLRAGLEAEGFAVPRMTDRLERVIDHSCLPLTAPGRSPTVSNSVSDADGEARTPSNQLNDLQCFHEKLPQCSIARAAARHSREDPPRHPETREGNGTEAIKDRADHRLSAREKRLIRARCLFWL